MKIELVRIHARLCGDGCISVYETSEKDRNMRGVVQYTNLDKRNINEFRNDMSEVFDVKTTFYKDTAKVKSLRIVRELEEKFGELKSRDWYIPDNIFSLTSEKKYAWVRAFVRDEGYYNQKTNRLRIKSMNKNGLTHLGELLEDLDIESTITGPNCDNSYYLSVSGLKNYRKLYEIASNKQKVRQNSGGKI